ncbi:hypothetical protein SEUCBS139899_001428 [Sporothrix eucalyptigena]|uniref:Protein kinase domain-containing protein n=1 Tax=Sporothrix eucalyptigena TaxID=1812306 RepID=A0ABP0B8S2_9PEZI
MTSDRAKIRNKTLNRLPERTAASDPFAFTMDLRFKTIHDVVHATAAFAGHPPGNSHEGVNHDGIATPAAVDGVDFESDNGVAWTMSLLNPKNRIDSLEPLADPTWHIQGAAGLGTQFHAYPAFLGKLPPAMHIDTFVEEAVTFPLNLRRVLDMHQVFHIKDKLRVGRLGITRHIERILHYHTVHPDGKLKPDVVDGIFKNGPFGTMIIIRNLTYDIRKSQIEIYRNHQLESDLKSYVELKTMWGLTDGGDKVPLPPEIDISDVRLISQLADSISKVLIMQLNGRNETATIMSNHHRRKGKKDGHQDKSHGRNNGTNGEPYQVVVLKAVSDKVRFLYQELRALLRDVPPHSGILSRPLHVVTKRCLFGNKTGVIGFTMPYYKEGSLRDALPLLRIHGQLNFATQVRWASQITEAMCHVWHKGNKGQGFYYPDLRLDNVVLTAPGPDGDVGLIDFEQRGVWSDFSSPEVDYIESLRVVAFDEYEFEFDDPDEVCEEHFKKLKACYDAAAIINPPPPTPMHKSTRRHVLVRLEDDTKYSNPPNGYNIPWNCLTKPEQEAAMVYMLGRLLWCIFEGMSAPHRGAIWQSYPREPELEFPAFRQTPLAAQKLILKCFGDAGAQEQSQFMRHCSKLYIKQSLDASELHDGGPTYKLVSDNLEFKAREFWHKRLAEGDAWLNERNQRLREEGERIKNGENKASTAGNGNSKQGKRNLDASLVEMSTYGRPTLRQVLHWLQELDVKPGN